MTGNNSAPNTLYSDTCGIRQPLICVHAVRNKRCLTLSTHPLKKLNGGLSQLHSADNEAIAWLTNYGS